MSGTPHWPAEYDYPHTHTEAELDTLVYSLLMAYGRVPWCADYEEVE